MYDPQDDALFGHDMRHKPPITIALTEKKGWGDSRGRLAYSQIIRTQELNVSEYAIRMTGGVPIGYVIVNAREVPYRIDPNVKDRIVNKSHVCREWEISEEMNMIKTEQSRPDLINK